MAAPKVGQVIHSKYRLLRHIGDGGMGSVYEARHETLGTTVALKFLHLEFARREGLVQRFLQEARASARIQSPHVVRVSDVDQTPDGDVFIVLEYLEGKTLQALYEDLYRAGRKLPYADALDYAEQMLDGVEAAHAAGIVHRDLKPDNVMITLDAKGVTVLKLLDFGIAKLKVMEVAGGGGNDSGRPGLTRPGAMMGTPEYMAPEQVTSADTVDARADVFALGVIIFEMLGGQRPVGGDNPLELAAAYRDGKVARLGDLVPGIAPELAAAVHRAIAANAKDRFATAAEMRERIAPFAAAVRAPSPSRLRAGGTIGVSVAVEHDAAPAASPPLAAPPLAAPPPPTTESRPLGSGVAKTWPPDDPSPGAPDVALAAPGRVSTVVDEIAARTSASPASMGRPSARDRTHRIGEPYAPMGATAPAPMGATAPAPPMGATVPAPIMPLQATVPIQLSPPTRRGGRRGGLTATTVLVTAACVAGAVTGVAYLASRSSSSRDDDPAPRTKTTATAAPAVPTQPPPAEPAEPPPYVAPPVTAPPIPTQTRPSPGPSARPKPSPSAPAPSSSAEPSAPPPPPALIIPSALPFPNPFDP